MIIILGSARSGTTWLGKLFDSHPDVVYRHEPDSVNLNVRIPFLPERDQASQHLADVHAYLLELKSTRCVKSVGKRPFFVKNYRNKLEKYGFIASVSILKAIESFCRSRTCSSRLRVPRSLDVPSTTYARFVIKSVSSLGRAHLFSRAWPTAKIIHVLRHPCGVVASRLRGVSRGLSDSRTYLDSLFSMKESENYPIRQTDLQRRSLEEQMTYHWMIINDKVINEMSGNPQYTLVQYEDLCRSTCKLTKDLFAWVGLDWSAQTRAFVRRLQSKKGHPSSYFSVIRSPGEAAERWQRELNEEQISKVLSIYSHSRIRQLGLGW